MNSYSTGEVVGLKTLEHEEKAIEVGLSLAKFGVAGSVLLAPVSPLLGIVSLATCGAIDMALSSYSQRRVDRVKTMIATVVQKVPEQQLAEKLEQDEDYAELFVDGMKAVSEAKERIRIQMVAHILASGVNPHINIFEAKRNLTLLNGLNELELIIFITVNKTSGYYQDEFKHAYLAPPIPTGKFHILGDNLGTPVGDAQSIKPGFKMSAIQIMRVVLMWSNIKWSDDVTDIPAYVRAQTERSLDKMVDEKILVDTMPGMLLGGTARVDRLHPGNRILYKLDVLGEQLASFIESDNDSNTEQEPIND